MSQVLHRKITIEYIGVEQGPGRCLQGYMIGTYPTPARNCDSVLIIFKDYVEALFTICGMILYLTYFLFHSMQWEKRLRRKQDKEACVRKMWLELCSVQQ